jgi:hypothetical protein
MSNNPEMLFGDLPFYSATREPCIVCGHTTGDCLGDATDEVRIFGIHHSTATATENTEILVEEDIVQETQITPFTKAKILVARKGSYISMAKAKELGII